MTTWRTTELVAILAVAIIGSVALTAMTVNHIHSVAMPISTTNTLAQMVQFENHVNTLRFDVQRFDQLLDVMHDEALHLRLLMEIGSQQERAAIMQNNTACVDKVQTP